MMAKSCPFVSSGRSVTSYKKHSRLICIIEILIASFPVQVIKSITIKQVVFGSFRSTTNAKRTVNDVFLKRGGD